MNGTLSWPTFKTGQKFTEFQETELMETTSGGGGDGGMQGIKSKVCNITYNSNKFNPFHINLTIPSHFQYSSLQPYRCLLPWMTSPVYKKLQEAQLGQAQVTLCIELFSCNQNKSLCTSTCHFHTCCTFMFLFLGTSMGYQAATGGDGRGGTQHQQRGGQPVTQQTTGGAVRQGPGNILQRTVFMQSEQVTLYFNLSLPHLLHLYVSIFRDRYRLSSSHRRWWKRWNTTPTMRRTTCHSTNHRRRS